ncbi:MAG: F0F1 ATP synthase subunit epsilon [Chloroflexi bacterium]|nr:F0F1 ATP synthase subunit epsilon [Chloroflexota bacterium]
MPLQVSVVTAEREISSRDDVQRLIVPTTAAPTPRRPGPAALLARLYTGFWAPAAGGDREPMVVHGGFIQILRDQVTVLADAAESIDEIDEARAEAARERASERVEGRVTMEEAFDMARARLALLRAQARIRIYRKYRGM